MSETLVLGLDCGGTHTDAALLLLDQKSHSARLLAGAKTSTIHEDLPHTIHNVMMELAGAEGGGKWIHSLGRIILGTTLLINALVRDKADRVGLAISAGPGIDPAHFTIGDYWCVAPGGLDHRGEEVTEINLEKLKKEAKLWQQAGVAGIACVGKFSPRNPEHETAMGNACREATGLPVTLGHSLSGRLNFPRRICTAYYNVAVSRLQKSFLLAVEQTFSKLGIIAKPSLLKADGGAIPFALAKKEPVHSILSGPAASVMGMLALDILDRECALLLDIGGTTTDIAVIYQNSPVIDRDGMKIKKRHTLVNSLASLSIGIGGDSLLHWGEDGRGEKQLQAGPQRLGAAMAFGGTEPTLLDAFNVLRKERGQSVAGNYEKSLQGLRRISENSEISLPELAVSAIDYAVMQIRQAVRSLLEEINSKPIYTLAGLKNIMEVRPEMVVLAGGPAGFFREPLEAALQLPASIAPHSDIANAIGASLTLPTASLEIFADGSRCSLTAPALNLKEKVSSAFNLEDAKKRARQLLREYLEKNAGESPPIEITEADLFAVLDERGRGSRDIRVTAQVRPGIAGRVLL